MSLRITTALIAIPLLILISWVGSVWLTIFVMLVAIGGASEVCTLAYKWGDRPTVILGLFCAGALVILGHLLNTNPPPHVALFSILPILTIMIVAWMIADHGSGTRLAGVKATIGSSMYTGGTLFYIPLIRGLEEGFAWLVLLFITIFASDTGALFVGRLLGKKSLAPTISPTKTWEGAIGGLLASLVAAVVMLYVTNLDVDIGKIILLGISIGFVAQVGDLVESKLKRQAGVDNSGNLLPGHGGILDRLDSIVFNLVVVYYFAI